jgi:hypothetical protein
MYLTHDRMLAGMAHIADIRRDAWWCPSCGLASASCRPISEHATSEGMVRYLWCATDGWLVTHSDVQLIRVSGPTRRAPAEGGPAAAREAS